MKTKFYAKDTSNGDFFPEPKLIQADMGILIEYGNKKFTIQEDNFGRLILTSVGSGLGLVLTPRSWNSVVISSED
jgi:hypothetical protein